MTQEEIIEMARQAGCTPRRSPEFWEDIQVFATPDVIVKFASLVAAKEREACANVLDEMAKEAEAEQEPSGYINYYRRKATEIRARGEQA